MNNAIFLDRDGVINKNRNDYVKSIDELEIFPFVGNSIKKLKKMGFIVIVITNQSAINRKLTTSYQVDLIHQKIQSYLYQFDTSIDKFYYCPHTPEQNCNCRKPKTELFLRAIKEFQINTKFSWMIGDNQSDLDAGRRINCSVFKVDNHFTLEDVTTQIEQVLKH